ncbi:MAG: TonB-dependent receptor [Bacteroidales bacterium]|nr:TonB-dependent receptor [Bacteroidales bacterium]
MKKKLLLSTFLLIFSFWAWSQEVQISGVVKSATDNLPLPGASVVIKGTVTGTTTDINGKYTLKASPKQVLVYSFVGMTAYEITVTAGTNNVDVTLSEAAVMTSEVVVVGYGTQKKSVTTGAISSVKAKDMEKTPNGRVEQALQGRVSGVTIAANSGQPGAASTIRIRGVTTFGDGGNNPLWVVDGVVVAADGIGYINQADIASIEVLKDAASAAIYGTRAATGVILVTTKKGQAGKMQVNYNAFYGTSAPAKTLKLLNATQYATLINERQTNGGLDIKFPNVGQYGTGTDWQKAIFNTNAMRYSHELSVSGGNDRSTFYTSIGITNQEGIVLSEISNYNKISIRLNSEHKISKVFTFGQTLGYTHQKSIGIGNTNSEFGGPLSSAINLDPITPLIETDPLLAAAYPAAAIRDANGNPYGISPTVGQEMTNPLAYSQTRLGQFNWSDDIAGNAYLEVNINKHIKIRSSAGAKLAFWGWQGFTPTYYLNASTSNTVNNYGQSNATALDWNLENTLLYSNKIQDHEFSILLGQGAYVNGIGGGTSNTIQGLPITSYEDASFNFNIPQANRISGTYDYVEHKISSLFSRINYNYKEKYMFTGIIRRDGSTRFGANYKYGIFPSFSLGWVVSGESFWKTNDIINTLKIRGGYGVNGNDGSIGDFGYLSTVVGGFNYTIGNTGNITTGYAPRTLDNPDLHWEETSQLNIGVDVRFLTNFNAVFEVFKKSTNGILRNIPIPGYVGTSEQPVGNVADMYNKGIEFELGYNKTFGEVTFSANGNVAYLKNEVTYVNSDANFITGGASFQSMGPVTRIAVGQSYNSFYGYKSDGIFQNWNEVNAYVNPDGGLIQPKAAPGDLKWVDTDGDGLITEADKTFLGSSIPKYTFGLTLNAAYKGFDIMIFGQGAAGNKIFQGLRRLDIEYSNWQTVALSRWTGEGTSNTYPRLTANDVNENFGKMSDFYLEKGDYLRLKQLQIGYTINAAILKKIDISKLRVYVQSENLLTITKYTGYDPEIGGGVSGIDKGFYPQARSFIAGIQLQF